MGAVKVMLAEKDLKDRERHNSRLFVDLCENIHIHYREYRFVFSLDEYFEFVDIVSKSTEDVVGYLRQNPDYREEEYKTTLMVAGGRERQMKFLENSPQPDRSYYFNNSLRLELQEEYVTDEIHIHYRDFRLALNRENFKDMAAAFTEAHQSLLEFEKNNAYERDSHGDREVPDWSQNKKISESDTDLKGCRGVEIDKVRSHWHQNILTDWNPDPQVIAALKTAIQGGRDFAPVVLTKKQSDGNYLIIDGHHRVRAALEEGKTQVPCFITELDWDESQPLRDADRLLKQFDANTGYQYKVSEYFKSYLGNTLNRYYRDHFYHTIKKPGLGYRMLKQLKKGVLSIPMPDSLRNKIVLVSGSKKYW